MKKFLLSQKVIIGHNFKRWDVVHLQRILGIKITAKIIDTLALSWYLYPEDEEGNTRRKHGLEEWGEQFGIPKPEIKDWYNLSVEEYTHRCEEDVKINFRLWENMKYKLKQLYNSEQEIWKFLDYLEFKMYCAQLQEEAGWKLDREYTEKSLIKLLEEQEQKLEHLKRVMPKVPVIKKKSSPKKMYNKDGNLTKNGLTWLELIQSQNLPIETTEIEVIDEYVEPNPNSPDQVKDWLYSLGWKPKTFKEVKDKKTGEKRQVPQINKEKQKRESDDDILCDSVTELFSKEPELEHLEGLGILKHRIGILNGYLRDVDGNGKLHARFSGLTNTLRFKHAEIVNLPKVDLPWAESLRGSLIADEGEELCGADMSGLEDRLKQHFIYRYDPDYVREMMHPDYDPHLSLALLASAVTPEQVKAYVSKVDKKTIKPIRDIYKNGNYACQYNAYPPRLAITCGVSLKKAQEIFDTYWKKNWAIKEVVKTLMVKKLPNGETWQFNPISRFWYSLRSMNDQFSTLVQGTAAYVFDLWVKKVLEKREQLTAQFHDEIVLSIKKGFREQAEQLLNQSIRETNDELMLNRELDIGIQFGLRYSDIH